MQVMIGTHTAVEVESRDELPGIIKSWNLPEGTNVTTYVMAPEPKTMTVMADGGLDTSLTDDMSAPNKLTDDKQPGTYAEQSGGK